MNCLVIGYGSIGARHSQILKDLNCSVSLVSKRNIIGFSCYESIETAIKNEKYDYVIIANDTSDHYPAVLSLIDINYCGIVLIEKPIFTSYSDFPKNNFKNIYVAYNLRFNPLIQYAYNVLKQDKIYSIQAYVGQFLPLWRPARDYRLSYSASKIKGGGVLRDLSHELDYLLWMLDGWKRVTAMGGKVSNLAIDSDDIFSILLETDKCPIVSLQMNYLDQKARREVIINCESQSMKLDLINNKIEINDVVKEFHVDSNYSYREQHKAIINNDNKYLCTHEQGLAVLALIEKAEEASKKGVWLTK